MGRVWKGLIGLMLMFVMLFNLLGCGGGGGGGGGAVETPPASPEAGKIWTIRPGDRWSYEVQGTLYYGGASYNGSGTASAEILSSYKQSPITKDYCLNQYLVISISFSGTPLVISQNEYYLQSNDGSIYVYGSGINSQDIWVVSPAEGRYLNLKSPLVVGQSYNVSVTYNDGETMLYSYYVHSFETVQTKAGNFDVYKIEINRRYDDSSGAGYRTEEHSFEWYSPNCGIIKETAYISYYSGGSLLYSLAYTAELTWTNLPR